ncbi:MAG: phosphoglycolate phosphatase [Pseudomonadota bacterium]|nr:phosphoglycolate phosphatase [Pseudomonadota bacterium]
MPQAGLRSTVRAVLFDLDGTLIDSAPDLAGAGNEMRLARGLEALPYASFRPMVGSGARGMVAIALQAGPTDAGYAELRDEFLQRYEARMTRETHVFAHIPPVLDMLSAVAVPWGIVTNKATRFAVPLVAALGLDRGAAALICGDTTPHAKPHPEPLHEAARRIGVPPAGCVYVGDDLRDVQAGRAAAMATVIAGWGYLGLGDAIESWGADHIVHSPNELLKLLAMA